eukprot:SM000345S12842  [mRNA]  locus=s345:39626:42945:- [translate_table: standard]
MLTLRRVPTLLSLRQDDLVCGKDCLAECCLAGAMLPLYSFARRYSVKPKRVRSFGDLHTVPDVLHDPDSSSAGGAIDSVAEELEKSLFDTLLLSQWEERMEQGLFRYDVTACETKVLPGEYGFIAQLNEGRHSKKRPTEFKVDRVLQDFDGNKFNFTKVGQEEVLFRFEESEDGRSGFQEEAPLWDSPNVVVINVSPIEYGHVLLVPRVLDRHPQSISADKLLLALHMALEADNPYFRLGYNSLGAFATINHLHFQAYYLTAPFPVERAPTHRVPQGKRKRGVKISELRQYPVRGLVFEVGSSLEELAAVVAGAACRLESENVPFNILIADRGARVFLFPQCFAERQARNEVDSEILATQVNPAVWEISGHIVLKRAEDYEGATEASAWRLLSEVSLSAERFQEVKTICLREAEKALQDILPALVEAAVRQPPAPAAGPAGSEAVVRLASADEEALVVGSDSGAAAGPKPNKSVAANVKDLDQVVPLSLDAATATPSLLKA